MTPALSMPGGDPAALEQYAARLDAAATGTGDLSASSRQVTGDIRASADWTGDAADGYTAFTGNLSTGVSNMESPLARIASAVRDYASSLRAAQQRVAAYSTAARAADASGHPSDVASARAAEGDAASAVTAQQAAGDHAAALVREAGKEMENPFGPEGPVRAWIEKIHAPWDVLVGDAAVSRALARVAEGEQVAETASAFQKGLAATLMRNAREMNAVLEAADADVMTQASEIDRLLTDTLKMARWNTGMREAGEALTKGAVFWKSVAAGSDLLAIGGDYFTLRKPEDSGVMGTVDRSVAGVNMGLSTVDLALLATSYELPVVGQVALIGTGLYLGGDYLYHHWTPFRDVCNQVGHATVAGADDVAHAAVSGAKDAWHAITSL